MVRLSVYIAEKAFFMPVNSMTATLTGQSITMVGWDGASARHSINNYPAAATSGQLDTVRLTVGAISNAGIEADVRSTELRASRAAITAFDEAESSVTTKAIFIFQNALMQTRRTEVPAPDASIFNSDGKTVNLANAAVLAYTNAVIAVLNAGSPAGTFAVLRGTKGGRQRKGGFVPQVLSQVAEPEEGQSPPANPALDGEDS